MSARGTCFLHFKMWRNTALWCVRRREMVACTLKVCQTIAFRQFCSNLLRGLCLCADATSYSQALHACVCAGACAQAVMIRLKRDRFPSEISPVHAPPLSSLCILFMPPLSDWLRVSSVGAVLFVGEQVRKTMDYILSVRIHGLVSRFFVHWKRRAASSALVRCRLPPARPYNLPSSVAEGYACLLLLSYISYCWSGPRGKSAQKIFGCCGSACYMFGSAGGGG